MGDTTASKVLLITGDPGVGKSSFVAHELLFNDSVGAAVYCEWNNPASNSPECVAMSIAYQLACSYPDYRLLLVEELKIEVSKKGSGIAKDQRFGFRGWCLLRQGGKAEEALAQFEESYRIRHRLYGNANL